MHIKCKVILMHMMQMCSCTTMLTDPQLPPFLSGPMNLFISQILFTFLLKLPLFHVHSEYLLTYIITSSICFFKIVASLKISNFFKTCFLPAYLSVNVSDLRSRTLRPRRWWQQQTWNGRESVIKFYHKKCGSVCMLINNQKH